MQHKKTGRTKSKKAIWITLAVAVLAAIIIFSFYNSNQQAPKKPADQYFEFSQLGALARAGYGGNDSIRINTLAFNITAVEGDALHVVLFLPGGIEPATDGYSYDRIPKGNSIAVEVSFRFEVLSTKQTGGYPVKFRVYSDEAEGYVTLTIPEEDVILV